MGRLGLAGPRLLVDDVFAALRAGLPGTSPGVVVSAGTGVIAAGRAGDGWTWRTLGLGTGPGDWGAGPDVVRAAVDAVGQEAMGLGPATALSALVAARCDSVEAFLEAATRRRPVALTPADVWSCAATGDAVALGVADRVASSLALAAVAVARRLGLQRPYDVVLAGRVLDPGHPLLHDLLVAHLAERSPGARARRLGVPPVVGAVLLASDAAGWDLPAVLA